MWVPEINEVGEELKCPQHSGDLIETSPGTPQKGREGGKVVRGATTGDPRSCVLSLLASQQKMINKGTSASCRGQGCAAVAGKQDSMAKIEHRAGG